MSITSEAARDRAPSFLCCGVRIDAIAPYDVVRLIHREWKDDQSRRTIHLCNAYTLSLAARDSTLARELNSATLNLPDGNPVVWAARRRGITGLRERIPGADLMTGVIAAGQAVGLRHYFYGGTRSVLQKLTENISARFPDAIVAGAESPRTPFLASAEEAALRDRLRSCAPDVIWVALGTPAQDHFIESFLMDVNATFISVGAAFDFISGAKQRAPKWVQSVDAEWLFRLVQEPRRLWRRYLIDSPLFFYYASKR